MGQQHGKKKNNLDIEEDLDFARREWAIQRVSWAVMGLLGLAALLGLFGEGLLSKASTGAEASPVQLQYERFGRRESPMEATMRLQPTGQEAQVWISREYLEGMEIDAIAPEPDSVEAATDRLLYTFALEEPNQPITVTMHLKPQHFGVYRGELGVPAGEAQRFTQYIYP